MKQHMSKTPETSRHSDTEEARSCKAVTQINYYTGNPEAVNIKYGHTTLR